MLIAADHITKSFRSTMLLDDCSLYVSEKDKIGMIGRNGTGKSTLLQILAGKLEPDSGAVTIHGSIKVGYLPQNPEINPSATILQQVLGDAAAGGESPMEYEARHILGQLGISQFDALMGALSGGQKKRVALASVLIAPCEVLLLDEPTNHLDNDMILWLEQFLRSYSGAIVMVTHDRYFLDRVANRIVEVSGGHLYQYEGGYSQFLEGKAVREEVEAGAQRKRQSLLRRELEWIQRGVRARGTKSRSRIQRFEELSGESGPGAEEKLALSSVASRLGKKIVELHDVSKAYGDNQLIREFSHNILRDARIGVVGPNGCGKSTLLQIISGRVLPDSGVIETGDTVNLGYFTQEWQEPDSSLRVIDYIKSFGNSIETVDGTLTAAQMLEQFLFPADLQWNTIARLSGGEKRRLFLLSILMTAPNVLLLDEPTNDLDIDTLMVLEEYIRRFPGAVVVVSHDRYLLDKVTDHIWEFQPDGSLEKYLGGYSDYLNSRGQARTKIKTEEAPKKAAPRRTATPQKLKFTFNEQREYEVIDDQLAELEQQLEQVKADITLSAADYEKLEGLLALQTQLEQQLEDKTQRWFHLHELAEQIAEQESAKE